MGEESLFERRDAATEPLAARMRPRFLDEFVGQNHILGPGKLLRRAITADMLSSLIFYGPPGTGKTTLARVIANTTKSSFISLNAVLAGVKDVRAAIDQAKQNDELYDRRTILFVDEVHRWNKAQQDALLPWVENGTVILIGATTHNPFFEVNSALVSRSRIFQLKKLTADDMRHIAKRTLTDPVRGYGRFDVRIDDDALEHLVAVADGDARGLLGALQLAIETSVDPYPPEPGTVITIDQSVAEDSIQRKAVLYDKEGDYHFDVISAFIKSLRGSDPDAALYWLAKMVHSGEDPRYIFRRMLIAASEDVGLADPGALGVVEAAAAAFDRVGMPEGRFHLAQAALYLATCPKSNSTLGFFDALHAVETEQEHEVPNHLRDASRDKEGFGHGAGYRYPHAYSDHWAAQAYLPAGLRNRLFYEPSDQGYEASVAERVRRLRELQMEVGLPEPTEEVLTYSASGDRDVDRWLARADGERALALASIRDEVIAAARIGRHHTVFVGGSSATLVLWDAVRASPEGQVVAVVADRNRYEAARRHAEQAHPLIRPLIVDGTTADVSEVIDSTGRAGGELEGVAFDRFVFVDPAALARSPDALFTLAGSAAADGARLSMAQRIPRESQRLGDLITIHEADLAEALSAAERRLYEDPETPMAMWSEESVVHALEVSGWTIESASSTNVTDLRRASATDINRWFSPNRPTGLGRTLRDLAGEKVRDRLANEVLGQLAGTEIRWRVHVLLVTANRKADG